MTALSTPNAPTIDVVGADEVKVTWTQVADADTYILKVYPKLPKTSADYDLEDEGRALTVTRTPGTGSTEAFMIVRPENGSPESAGNNNMKFTVTAHDSTDAKTDATSSKSSAANVVEPEPGSATEAAVATDSGIASAGQTYGKYSYTRELDGTVSQTLVNVT